MNFKEKHRELIDMAKEAKTLKDDLFQKWIDTKCPYKPKELITIPETNKLYPGLVGRIDTIKISMAGDGPIYYWQLNGVLVDSIGKATGRKFKCLIKMKDEEMGIVVKKNGIVIPKPKHDPLISGRLV